MLNNCVYQRQHSEAEKMDIKGKKTHFKALSSELATEAEK